MQDHTPLTDTDDIADLSALAAESMGWQPLGESAYLHYGGRGNPQEDQVIHVVGIPDFALTGLNVLLLT